MKVYLRYFYSLLIILQANVSISQQLDWKDSLVHFKESGDLTQFYKLLEKKSSQDLIPKYFLGDLGNYFLISGRSKEAITAYNQFLEYDPLNPELYLNRGMAYWNLQQYDSANKDFSEAIWRCRSDDTLRFKLNAIIYSHKEDFLNAKLYIDSAISLINSSADLYHMRAQTLCYLKDFTNALMDADRACQLQPENNRLRYVKARLNLMLKRPGTAMNEYHFMAETNPADPLNDLILGEIYIHGKEPEKALIHMNKALAKTDEFYELDLVVETYFYTAMCYFYLVLDEKAIYYFQKILSLGVSKEARISALIGLYECKNNLKPGSGCEELKQAAELGHEYAMKEYERSCR